MQTKICSECNIEKPISEFYKDKCCLFGVRSKCKECDKKKHHERYQNNREQIILQNKKWKDKIKREKELPFWNMRAKKENDRCKSCGVDGVITGEELQDIFIQQGQKCFYCHCDLNDELHVDHIVPISQGGENNFENIAITCKFCNLHKSNNIFDEKEFFDYVKENYYRLRDKYEVADNPVGKS